MKKRYSSKIIRPEVLGSILTIVLVLFISIGYSAFNNELTIGEIDAKVRIKADIRITGVSINPTYTQNGTSSYEEYNVRNLAVGIELPNADSQVAYSVEVTNIGNAQMGLFGVTGLPDNLTYEVVGYNQGDAICDDNKCDSGVKKDMIVIFKYKNGGYDSSNTTYNFIPVFDFRAFYNVTYGDGFKNTYSYPKTVIAGGDLNVNFGAETQNLVATMGGTPLVKDTDYTLSDDAVGSNTSINIPNVNGDIYITSEVRVMNDALDNEGTDRVISAGGIAIRGESQHGVFLIDGSQNNIFANYPYWVRLSGQDVRWYEYERNFKSSETHNIVSAPANVKFEVESLSGSCSNVEDGALTFSLYDYNGDIFDGLSVNFTDYDFNTPNTIAVKTATIDRTIGIVGLVVKRSGGVFSRMSCSNFTFAIRIYTY